MRSVDARRPYGLERAERYSQLPALPSTLEGLFCAVATRFQRRTILDVMDVWRLPCAKAETMWLGGCCGEFATFLTCWLLCVGRAGGTVDRQSFQNRWLSSTTAPQVLPLEERELRGHRCSLRRGTNVGFREHS